jgi:hypothetical protein
MILFLHYHFIEIACMETNKNYIPNRKQHF